MEEKPWRPEKIREESSKWTLAGDNGLFAQLQTCSNSLLDSTANVERQLDDVLLSTARNDVKFRNIQNNFLALANTQFIENRVYDDDVADCSQSKPETIKTKTEKEAELTECMKMAMNTGFNLMQTHFHKIELKPEAFDEDDDPTFRPDPIYDPLDVYVNRALPFIIGSKEFLSFSDVRADEEDIVESKESAKKQEESDEEIVITVESPRRQQEPSTIAGPSTSQKTEPMPAVQHPEKAPSDNSGLSFPTSDSESDNDLFDKKLKNELVKIPDDVKAIGASQLTKDIQAELAGRLKRPIVDAEATRSLDDTSSAERTPTAPKSPFVDQQEAEDDEDLFPSTSNTSKPQTPLDATLRTSGILFLHEQEDDNDPFLTIPVQKPSFTSISKPTTVPRNEPKRVVASVAPKKEVKPTGGLFGSDADDDDDDIFAVPVKGKSTESWAAKSGRNMLDSKNTLFSDDESEDDTLLHKPPTGAKQQDIFTMPKANTQTGQSEQMFGNLETNTGNVMIGVDSPQPFHRTSLPQKPPQIEQPEMKEQSTVESPFAIKHTWKHVQPVLSSDFDEQSSNEKEGGDGTEPINSNPLQMSTSPKESDVDHFTKPSSKTFKTETKLDTESLVNRSLNEAKKENPTADPARALAGILNAGLLKHSTEVIEEETKKNITTDPPLVDDALSTVCKPLESVSKTRAKIPSSTRRPPTKRPSESSPSSNFISSSSSVEEKVESIEERVESVEERVESIEERVESVQERIESVKHSSPKPTPPVVKPVAPITPTTNLFDDDDIFDFDIKQSKTPVPSQTAKPVSQPLFGHLQETDIFAQMPASKDKDFDNSKEAPKKSTNIFDDSDSDLDVFG